MERERPTHISLKLSCYDCSFTFTVNTDNRDYCLEGAGNFISDVADGHEEMTGHETYLEVTFND